MDRVLSADSSSYPRRLRGLRDAPRRLHVRGTWREHALAVALVGARAASGRGVAMAEELAGSVAGAGGLVLSGGAIGIDGAAHRGALEADGATACVLAGGLEELYPARHRSLFAAIAERGALVSSFAPETPPRRYQFVRRNRVIAGLADLVVVVEAERASGSLYTARAALEYGRRLAAVPGSAGCEALIAEGALPIETPAALLEAARGERPAARVTPPAPGSDEDRVLEALGDEPRLSGQLSDATGLDEMRVNRALAGLELARLALAVPGAAYVRSALAGSERR